MEYAYKIIIKIIVFIIIGLYYNINIISKFHNFISYISFKKEIKEMDNYLNICKNFKIIKKFKIMSNTKISIISPIYNRERFISIKSCLRSEVLSDQVIKFFLSS